MRHEPSPIVRAVTLDGRNAGGAGKRRFVGADTATRLAAGASHMHLGHLAFDAVLFLDFTAVLALRHAIDLAAALALFGFFLFGSVAFLVGLFLRTLRFLIPLRVLGATATGAVNFEFVLAAHGLSSSE